MEKKVLLIGTGGTISGGIDPISGEKVSLHAKNLVELIPEYKNIVFYEDFINLPSSNIDIPLAYSLINRINAHLVSDPKLTGVVVSHGTNTLEETAFLSWLLIDDPRPIIYTGAMRAPRYADSDGPRNLKNSISVAISEEAKNKGVMVCMNEQIHSARYVTKIHPISLNAFSSGDYGIIGTIYDNKVIFTNKSLLNLKVDCEKVETNIDIFKLSMGISSKYIEASINTSAKAIVCEVFGRGRIPPNIMEKILEARREGIIITIVSRCFNGSIYTEDPWEKYEIIYGRNLDSLKARLLLSVLIPKTKDVKEIQDIFNKVSGK